MSNTQWLAVAIAAAVIAAMAVSIRRWMRARMLHMTCPACGKRLTYKASSAGGHGMCPGCSEKLTFP